DGTTFNGGPTGAGTYSNGGVRSLVNELTVSGCTFTNTSAVAFDGADPGSALQVFNSDVVVTDTAFTGNRGTPLYVESSVEGASYTVEMDGTSFEDNEEAFVDASGNLTSQAAAAMLTAKDGGELVNGGTAALATTCQNNVPSACEVIVTASTLLFAPNDDSCNVCDESGTALETGSIGGGNTTVAVGSCDELKTAAESGESGTIELTGDITCS
ncbi:unnamed protein product, partial [Sphacelaria rigidula]